MLLEMFNVKWRQFCLAHYVLRPRLISHTSLQYIRGIRSGNGMDIRKELKP